MTDDPTMAALARAVINLPRRARIDGTVALIRVLPISDQAEVLAEAQYEAKPLEVAYDQATPRQRREFDKRRPARPLKEPRRSKFHPDTLLAPATDAERGIAELAGVLSDRLEQVSRGVLFTEAQQDAFANEASSRLKQILGTLERSTLRTPSRRQSLTIRWHSETAIGRVLWRKGEELGRTPEVIAFNALADSLPEHPEPLGDYHCPLGQVAR